MTTVPNPLDEAYTYDAQDPNDPVWTSDGDIAEMQQVDDPDDLYEQNPHIRTSSGELEFLGDVLQEVIDPFLERDKPVPGKKDKLDAIRTRELGADKWRPGVRAVNTTMTYPILVESDKRRRATFINYGPNIVYLAAVGGATPGGNAVQLPVSSATFWAPLTIQTRDNVWAECATGTANVEVIEEFDLED